MDAKFTKVYYSPQGHWKGIAAIKKLANAAKVSEDTVKKWLVKQALWRIYLPAPKHIPRPKFDVCTPNAVHQADLFLPHDTLGRGRGRKTYKYALTVVNVASRFKEAEPLTSKDSAEVSKSFEKLKFTEIRLLLKDSTAPWLNACLGISMLSKYGCHLISGLPNGSKGCLLLFLL